MTEYYGVPEASSPEDGGSPAEAEALVSMLMSPEGGGKSPRGAGNLLMLALATLLVEHGDKLPAGPRGVGIMVEHLAKAMRVDRRRFPKPLPRG